MKNMALHRSLPPWHEHVPEVESISALRQDQDTDKLRFVGWLEELLLLDQGYENEPRAIDFWLGKDKDGNMFGRGMVEIDGQVVFPFENTPDSLLGLVEIYKDATRLAQSIESIDVYLTEGV